MNSKTIYQFFFLRCSHLEEVWVGGGECWRGKVGRCCVSHSASQPGRNKYILTPNLDGTYIQPHNLGGKYILRPPTWRETKLSTLVACLTQLTPISMASYLFCATKQI